MNSALDKLESQLATVTPRSADTVTGLQNGNNVNFLVGDVAIVQPAPAYSVPTEGGTLTAVVGERSRIADPAGPLTALSLVLPPMPSDADRYEIFISQNISTFSISAPGGAGVIGNSFGMVYAPTRIQWVYRAANNIWYGAAG